MREFPASGKPRILAQTLAGADLWLSKLPECAVLASVESTRPARGLARKYKVVGAVALGVLFLGGLTCVATRSGPAGRVYDDELPQVAPRPQAITMSPELLPDRSAGKPIESKFAGASLDPTGPEIAALIDKVESEEWFGVYVNGEKVGFSRIVSRPARPGEPPSYLIALDEVVRSSIDGLVDVHQNDRAWRYATTEPYRLLSLETRESSGGGVILRRFDFNPEGGVLETTVDNGPAERKSLGPTQETVASSLGVEPDLVSVGARSSSLSFDEVLLKDLEWQTTVTRKFTRSLLGVEVPVAVLESYAPHDQSKYSAETAHLGRLLSVSMGEGFVMKAEPKQQATEGIGSMDAIHDGVAIDQPLGDPAKIRNLSLLLTTGQDFAPPDGPNQRVTPAGPGRYRLELSAVPGAEAQPGEREEYLAPSAAIDSDHPTIRQAAQQLAEKAPADQARVLALVDYVAETVQDSYESNLGTASQVLERKSGDCSEHTLLFVALARAAGLPAREISGLVYASDQERHFVWHAWAEVLVDGRWVAVDPTFGEAQANATHIKLGTERDARWVAYSKLKIEVGK